MKFSTGIPGMTSMPPTTEPWQDAVTAQDILRIARAADDLGYDSISVPDHVIAIKEQMGYLGPRWPDAVSTVGFLAGATKQIKVYNSVLVLPYYNPIIIAKAFATMDFLSGGRVMLGVGVGHVERESDILNVPYEERGPMTDEYLQVIRELWTSDAPRFNGRFFQFDDVFFEPKPIQDPHPPILVGGNSRRAVRRAVELGDGWVPFMLTPEEIEDRMAYLRDQASYQSRDRPFDITLPLRPYRSKEAGFHASMEAPPSKEEIVDMLGNGKDLGVTMTSVIFSRHPGSVDEYIEQLEWFAHEIMPAYKD